MTNLSTAAFRTLEPGDPWTFIYDAPVLHDSGRHVVVGELISKWFATNEPGRVFRITAIRGTAYETEYVGFETDLRATEKAP